MLRPRVIPCLLLSEAGLVKTIRFNKPNYVGVPLNVINIFNRLSVDELILLDIDASPAGRSPRFDIIKEVAGHCTAPLTYGGGIRDIDEIGRIFEIGVEKVVLGSVAARDPSFIRKAVDRSWKPGDHRFGRCEEKLARPLCGLCRAWPVRASCKSGGVCAERGRTREQGRQLLHSIDRDGEMNGYDVDLIRSVANVLRVPVIACGGAGTRQDLADAVDAGASAAAAGSIFVYQGLERGVLVNFPTRAQLRDVLMKSKQATSKAE